MSSKKGKNSKKTSTMSRYKKTVTSLSNLTPDYKAKYYKGTLKLPTYESGYTPGEYVDNYTPTQFNGSYSPGTYDSKYLPQIEEALGNITNWSYDPLQDASYQALAKVYGARGNVAAKNSLADAAALNGGYGSSYAVSAAQQARNQYNQELASFIPQLEQASYERQQAGYNALMDLDNALYGRFSDDESRRLQAAQYALDVAGFNEANNQFAANRNFDIFNANEANKQWAEGHNLDVFNANSQNAIAKADFGLRKFGVNQDERHYKYGTRADKIATGIDMLSGYLGYKDLVNGSKKTGSGGGGGGSRGGGGGGYSGGGYTGTTTTEDTYTKAEQTVADKKKGNKKVNKGTLNGNTMQYR